MRQHDKVMSRDEATGETSIQRVVQTFKKRANRLVKLRFSNGENIEATEEHPFYVPKRGFTAAKLLKAGALVATLSGPAAKVEAVFLVEKSINSSVMFPISVLNLKALQGWRK